MTRDRADELIGELAGIARRGPLPAVGTGAPAVGMTLLAALGIDYASTRKPQKNGIVVTARRGTRRQDPNRVNLFGMVPDWTLSPLKSSAEILRRYGYFRDGVRKLNCTVKARQPNTQGLFLSIDRSRQELQEWAAESTEPVHLVSWKLERLRDRLVRSHPATIWVTAQSSKVKGQEYFHYRYAVYSAGARAEALTDLIQQGTITVDHLISETGSRVLEKGPLFKIRPRNLSMLFPETRSYDLLSM